MKTGSDPVLAWPCPTDLALALALCQRGRISIIAPPPTYCIAPVTSPLPALVSAISHPVPQSPFFVQ